MGLRGDFTLRERRQLFSYGDVCSPYRVIGSSKRTQSEQPSVFDNLQYFALRVQIYTSAVVLFSPLLPVGIADGALDIWWQNKLLRETTSRKNTTQ